MVKVALIAQATAIIQLTALKFHFGLTKHHGNLGLGSGITVPAGIRLPFAGAQPKQNKQAGEKASGRGYIWIGHTPRIVIFSIFCPRARFGINIYGRLFIKQRMSTK